MGEVGRPTGRMMVPSSTCSTQPKVVIAPGTTCDNTRGIDSRTCVDYSNEKRLEAVMQAYCVKCRKKVEIKNPKAMTMKNKRPATQGVCPSCATKVFRIGKG